LIAAIARQAPPRHGLFRPKLRYAHQGGMNPPIIVIHRNQLDSLPESYRRYLERFFIDSFSAGHSGANPVQGQLQSLRRAAVTCLLRCRRCSNS
jgi:predicted GTPase